MREILFRGKRTDNGKWAEGFYTLYAQAVGVYPCILTGTEKGNVIPAFVDENTVGQFTGLIDKNGKKIWEGDIVKAKIIEFSGEKYIGIWEVAYHTEYGYFYLKRPENNLLFDGNWSYGVTKIEVIGNIHDNSELLKEGAEE